MIKLQTSSDLIEFQLVAIPTSSSSSKSSKIGGSKEGSCKFGINVEKFIAIVHRPIVNHVNTRNSKGQPLTQIISPKAPSTVSLSVTRNEDSSHIDDLHESDLGRNNVLNDV